MSEQAKVVDNWGNNYIAPVESKNEPNDVTNEPHTMKITLESITPAKAQEFLKHNTKNRNLIKTNVTFLANQMKANKWEDTGDTIKFATDGTLLDGQHRLHAIIESKKTYQLYVARGLKSKAFQVIDTGKSRAAKDVLSANGFKNPHLVGSAVSLITVIQKNGVNNSLNSSGKVMNYLRRTNDEVLSYALSEPDINEEILYIKAGYKQFKFITIPTLAALYHIMARQTSFKAADYFFDKYFAGDSLAKTDPIYILRAQLMQQNPNAKINRREHFAWIITAWNLYRAGEKTTKITYSHAEPIPKISR